MVIFSPFPFSFGTRISLPGPFLFLNNFRIWLGRVKLFQTHQMVVVSNPIRLGFTRIGLIFFHRVTFGHFRSQLRLPFVHSSILRLKGIGYKCWRRGAALFFDLSKSHFFCLEIPFGLTILIRRRRGIILFSSDSNLVSKFALKIRRLAIPNPYTGKGVRFLGEFKRLKPGKQRR
jgi:hypothetical protein